MNMKKIALPTFVMIAIIFSVFAACQNSNSKIFPENITEENTIQYPINNTINNGIYKAAVEFANSVSWTYDPAYYKIPYPNGDVPSGGACTDVIIRILRKNNIDLQQLIHEDISSNFDAYPNKWGLSSPDANIDHRRVPNIMKYFERNGFSKSITKNAIDYQPGDIVSWELSPGITHIGIVLENEDVFHNMGTSSRIEGGFLFSHKILGHYRI
jgi:hypothetical protein